MHMNYGYSKCIYIVFTYFTLPYIFNPVNK